jgi:hypothetical protein
MLTTQRFNAFILLFNSSSLDCTSKLIYTLLKCGAGEQRRSVGSIVWEMKFYTRVKEDRNILHTIKRRKANWIGHILRRNCLLKHVIEEKLKWRIEVMWRRGRRRKQLLDDLKEKRGYWKLKEEALVRTMWRTRFGRGHWLAVRQTTDLMRMNEWMN